MLATRDALGRLCERGFAVVDDVVPMSLVAETIAAIERLDGEAGLQRRGKTYAMRNVLSAAPAVRACAEHEGVTDLVREVLDCSAFVTRAILFDKNPSANWAVPWHQDTTIAVRARPTGDVPGFGPWSVKDGVPHVQPPASTLESMLTVRLHLDDCGEENAPLRVIAGSHHHGVLDGEPLERERSRAQTVCFVPAGGALVMRPLLLHASSPAEVPEHRRVLHLEWATGELPHGLEWHRA